MKACISRFVPGWFWLPVFLSYLMIRPDAGLSGKFGSSQPLQKPVEQPAGQDDFCREVLPMSVSGSVKCGVRGESSEDPGILNSPWNLGKHGRMLPTAFGSPGRYASYDQLLHETAMRPAS